MIFSGKKQKNIYLHIGLHKTGTTSIQKYLSANIEELKNNGYIYPKCCWFLYGHHRIPFSLKGQMDVRQGDSPDFDEEISSLKNCINKSNVHNFIISSEEFSVLNQKAIARLMEQLNNYNVKIVLYLRRQDHLLLSSYNQQIKDFNNKRSIHFNHIKNHINALHPRLDFYALVKSWEDYVGKDKMIVKIYQENKTNVISDFLQIFKIPALKNGNIQTNLNQSIHPKALEMIRIAKTCSLPPEKIRAIFEIGIKEFPGEGEDKYLLIDSERLDILSNFTESNEKLQKEYFPDNNNGLFDMSDIGQYTAEKKKDIILKNTDLMNIIGSFIKI